MFHNMIIGLNNSLSMSLLFLQRNAFYSLPQNKNRLFYSAAANKSFFDRKTGFLTGRHEDRFYSLFKTEFIGVSVCCIRQGFNKTQGYNRIYNILKKFGKIT